MASKQTKQEREKQESRMDNIDATPPQGPAQQAGEELLLGAIDGLLNMPALGTELPGDISFKGGAESHAQADKFLPPPVSPLASRIRGAGLVHTSQKNPGDGVEDLDDTVGDLGKDMTGDRDYHGLDDDDQADEFKLPFVNDEQGPTLDNPQDYIIDSLASIGENIEKLEIRALACAQESTLTEVMHTIGVLSSDVARLAVGFDELNSAFQHQKVAFSRLESLLMARSEETGSKAPLPTQMPPSFPPKTDIVRSQPSSKAYIKALAAGMINTKCIPPSAECEFIDVMTKGEYQGFVDFVCRYKPRRMPTLKEVTEILSTPMVDRPSNVLVYNKLTAIYEGKPVPVLDRSSCISCTRSPCCCREAAIAASTRAGTKPKSTRFSRYQ